MRQFTANQRNIYLYIRSLMPNLADVEEVFQQTNLVLWQKFDEFDPETNFRAWAFRVAFYETANHRSRSRKGGVRFSDEFLAEVAAEAERQSDATEARLAALGQCIDKLPEHDRRLIEGRYAEGASGESIAAALGRPTRWVYKAVTRIRRALLQCVTRTLEQEGLI